jgi:hypothetical protein
MKEGASENTSYLIPCPILPFRGTFGLELRDESLNKWFWSCQDV